MDAVDLARALRQTINQLKNMDSLIEAAFKKAADYDVKRTIALTEKEYISCLK